MEYSSLTEETETAAQNGDTNGVGVPAAAAPPPSSSKPRSPIANGGGGGVSSNGTSPTGIGSSANSVTSRGSLFSKKSRKSKSGSSRRSHRSGNTGELSEPLTMATSEGGDVEMGRRYNGGGGNTSDDPFHVFKDDLMGKLGMADTALAGYLGKIHGTDTAVNSHEIKSAKKQLKRHIKHAESTLKDLQKTIKSVESRREQFPHISDDELNTRRVFVHGARDRLHRIKSDMASDEVREKMMQDERALTRRRMGNGVPSTAVGGEGVNGAGHEDDALIVDQHAHAQMMLQEQDEALDDLDEAVENVGRMADEIHAELGTQNRMLTELEEDLSDAEEKLGLVMGKLAKLLKTKSKCQLGTILVLSFTVIILFFLVIYT